jgi:hypothetical protein
MATDKTALAESAQAVFCSMADKVGASKSPATFDLTKYPTFNDFIKVKKNQKLWKDSLKNVDVDVSESLIKDFLTVDHKWYMSSCVIAVELVTQIAKKVDSDFKISAPNFQKISYFRGDDEVMGMISKLYKLANNSTATKKLKNHAGFRDINKWNPADIYFATPAAIKKLASEYNKYNNAQGKKGYTFTDLNILVSDLLDSGQLLPLSLKKTTKNVDLYKINFDRKKELTALRKIKRGSISNWKPYKKIDWTKVKAGAKTETRDIRIFLTAGGEIKFRHDPSATRFVAEFIGGGAEARGGSIASHELIAILWSYVDSSAAEKFLSAYKQGDALFRKKLKKIEPNKKLWVKDAKDKKLNKFIHERGTISAIEIINRVLPILKNWLKTADDKDVNKFVQLMYEYVTSRTAYSGKFVIAK